MKVYPVVRDLGDSGWATLAVYSTAEKAAEARDKLRIEAPYDKFEFEMYELDKDFSFTK